MSCDSYLLFFDFSAGADGITCLKRRSEKKANHVSRLQRLASRISLQAWTERICTTKADKSLLVIGANGGMRSHVRLQEIALLDH